MKNVFFLVILSVLCLSTRLSAQACNSSTTYQQATICEGSSFAFYGQQLRAAGQYNDTIVLPGGCDSIISLQLFVNPTVYTHVTGLLCGGSYDFYGTTITQPGTYYDTLYASGTFCDSVIIMDLQPAVQPSRTIYADICTDTPAYYGHSYTYGGNFTVMVPAPGGGCDSLIHLVITDHRYYTLQNVQGCLGQQIYSSSTLYQIAGVIGFYQNEFHRPGKCDSVAEDYVSNFSTIVQLYLCTDTAPTYDGHIYTQPGSYTDTIETSWGCTQVIPITVHSIFQLNINLVACPGDSVFFDGKYFLQGRQYTDTVYHPGGCDTIFSFYVNPRLEFANFVRSGCTGDTVIYNGKVRSIPGYYRDTLPGSYGCDSLVDVILIASNNPYRYLFAHGCSGGSYSFDNRSYFIPGSYIDTIHMSIGCDSLVYIYIDTLPQVFTVQNYGCLGDTLMYNGHTYVVPASFYDTLTSSGGCDSIIFFTDNGLGWTVIDTGACGQNYLYNGHSYLVPGIYIDTLQSSRGCDSLIVLELIAQLDTSLAADTIPLTSCTGPITHFFNNYSYYFPFSGIYPVGVSDCRQHYANVQISYPVIQQIDLHACVGSPVYINGKTYTVPDTFDYLNLTVVYYDTIYTQHCDSITRLVLHVFPPLPVRYVADSVCPGASYTYAGQTITQAGTDTLRVQGLYCDTMVILTLHTSLTTTRYITDSFCQGSSYSYAGQVFTQAGTQMLTVQGPYCNTTVVLSLSYIHLAAPVIHYAYSTLVINPQPGLHYQWLLNGQPIQGATSYQLHPSLNGSYTVEIWLRSDTACPSISAPYVITNLGIGDISADAGINIYPVPNAGNFTIDAPGYAGGTLTIYDVIGRVVYEGSLHSDREQITIPAVSGSYSLVLHQGSRTARCTWVLER